MEAIRKSSCIKSFLSFLVYFYISIFLHLTNPVQTYTHCVRFTRNLCAISSSIFFFFLVMSTLTHIYNTFRANLSHQSLFVTVNSAHCDVPYIYPPGLHNQILTTLIYCSICFFVNYILYFLQDTLTVPQTHTHVQHRFLQIQDDDTIYIHIYVYVIPSTLKTSSLSMLLLLIIFILSSYFVIVINICHPMCCLRVDSEYMLSQIVVYYYVAAIVYSLSPTHTKVSNFFSK